MNRARMTGISVFMVSVIMLGGCQNQQAKQQLAECRQEVSKQEETIQNQQEEITKLKKIEQNYAAAMIDTITNLQTIENENKRLKEQIAELKKNSAADKKASEMTPEEKQNIKKGLQELFEMQKKSAERMKEKSKSD